MPIQSLLDRIRDRRNEPDAHDRYSAAITQAALPALAGVGLSEAVRGSIESPVHQLTGDAVTNRRLLDSITNRHNLNLRTSIPLQDLPAPVEGASEAGKRMRDVLQREIKDHNQRAKALDPGERTQANLRPFDRTENIDGHIRRYPDGTLRISPRATPQALAHEMGHAVAMKDQSDLARRIRGGASNAGPAGGILAALALAASGNETAQDLVPATLAAGFVPRVAGQAQALHLGAKELDAFRPNQGEYGRSMRRGLPGLLGAMIAPTVAYGASRAIKDRLDKHKDSGAIKNLMKYVGEGNYL